MKKSEVNDFGFQLFKFDHVAELLAQIEERMELMEMATGFMTGIGGVNVLKMWQDLNEEIKMMWMKDDKIPYITINKLQELKLLVISDLVAQFFLHNGSEVDNDFLKNVSDFFKEVNEKYKGISFLDRFAELKELVT